MLIIASAMFNDLIGWLIFSLILSLAGKGTDTMVSATPSLTFSYSDYSCSPSAKKSSTAFSPGYRTNFHVPVACSPFRSEFVCFVLPSPNP